MPENVYAIGGNERAARMSGVSIDKTKIGVYAISGFCSAIVGLIIASQLVAAHPMTGESYEMTAIARLFALLFLRYPVFYLQSELLLP